MHTYLGQVKARFYVCAPHETVAVFSSSHIESELFFQG